jgi:phosphoglycerol transferase MdoB-like AlkP superfamily enzyme
MESMFTKIEKRKPARRAFSNLTGIFKDNLYLIIMILLMFLKSAILVSTSSFGSGTHLAFNDISFLFKSFWIHIAFAALLLSGAYLFKGKIQVYLLLGINLLFSILLLSDLVYFRGFQGFLSIYALSLTGNLDGMGSSILSMFKPMDLLFFVDIIIILFINKKPLYKKAKRNFMLYFILLIGGIGIPFYYHYRYDVLEDGANRRYFYNYFSPTLNMSNMSPLGYHIHDLYSYFENSKRLVLDSKDKDQINSWYEYNNEALPDNEYKAMFNGKNLLFIQVESLEAMVINQKIEEQEITPTLNKLLQHSLYFPQIHEQVSGGNSSDADLMANTSMHPVRSGSTFFRYPGNKYNSMPVLMKKLGYYTSAFHPDGGGYWNWMPALQSMGFDKTTDTVGFNVDETIGYGLSDASYLKQLKDKLLAQPKPFYSFTITLTSHMPFIMPEDTKELKLSDNIGKTVLGDYLQSVRYADKHIGKLIEGLEEAGILDNTVVVIYGDHTGVHKYYKSKLQEIDPKEQWWAEDTMRVPLIIYSKGMAGKSFNTIGGQVDILPTVSYLMGVEESSYLKTAMGRNLLKTNRNFTILSNGKYIGDSSNETEKQKAVEALDISDKLIRSNYFKD